MRIELTVTTDIVTEPITLAEAKGYLRVDATSEDDLITELITAAREWAENYTGKAFGAKTYTVLFSELLSDEYRLNLPYPPHATITSVNAVDREGTKTLLVENTDYYVSGAVKASIDIYGKNEAAYEVVYTTSADAMTANVKQAMLKVIADMYENRQNEKEESNTPIKYDTMAMLAGVRLNPFRL